jgi:hypothetical protein
MARYTVLAATRRMMRRGFGTDLDTARIPDAAMEEPEPWMKAVAHASRKGLFLRAPLALSYVLRHPHSVPDRIPHELAAAGLVEKHGGKPWVLEYAHGRVRPYDRSGMCGMDHDPSLPLDA